jgi:pimeloyl-ACP methyl ester carboxylesterase
MIAFKAIRLAAWMLGAMGATAHASSVESFVEAKGPTGPLKGTMLSPAAARGPVVLIIPGSGPTDRDGNSPAGLKASTYRLLAEGLAERGITTVRIDKRGMFASAGATPDANDVTIAGYGDDVHSWANALRLRTGASCLWLLGHSEGGLVALAAAQHGSDLCGLILVSTTGRPVGELLREQLKANPANAPILGEALPAIDALEAGHHVDTTHMNPELMPLFAPSVQGFLINEFSYDPRKLLASIHKPVLILQGQRDIQVSEGDARQLKQANPAATLKLLPDTNHVLKLVATDDFGANVATYADPSLPLAPGVIDAITQFLKAHPQ